jgi:protein ImuA
MSQTKKDIIDQLQKEILLLQGYKSSPAEAVDLNLGPITAAFPNAVFPTGAIHEFISTTSEQAASSGSFVAGLISPLMKNSDVSLWISSTRKVFPPGLHAFGIDPDKVIFIDLKKEKDALWAMEEALKCEGLAAVIGEIQNITFTASRRLQLAVEHSRVTGFLLRHQPRNNNPIACIARWKISPLASELEPGMPGLGFPRWTVALERIRNGQPGTWQVEWSAGRFHPLSPATRAVPALPQEQVRQTG